MHLEPRAESWDDQPKGLVILAIVLLVLACWLIGYCVYREATKGKQNDATAQAASHDMGGGTSDEELAHLRSSVRTLADVRFVRTEGPGKAELRRLSMVDDPPPAYSERH